MKICLISNLFPPISRGGAEKVAETVAYGLKSVGHEVFVISTMPWGGWASLKPTAKEDGIKIYRFYPLNIFYYLNDWKHNALWRMKWHFWDIFNLHSRAVVKKILKKEKPDLVLTHNLKGIGYLIPRVIRGLGIKHVHTLHDVQLSTPSGLIIKGQENSWQQKIFLRKWYEAICRRLFSSPDVVISPSKWLLDFYSERGFFKNSKKLVLPNPIGLRSQSGDVAQQVQTITSLFPERSAAESKSNTSNLLYLGQIEEHKGILFLIKVLSEFLRHGVKIPTEETVGDWQLHIVGDGSKMEEVRRLVADDPRFAVHGKLPQEKIAEIFRKIDLTIVPSLCYENSPSVIYESLSFGAPVLAAKIGGVAELVHDGQNGFTFEAGNAEDLARALKHAAANRSDLQKMRSAAQESVGGFGVENYIKHLIDIIQLSELK